MMRDNMMYQEYNWPFDPSTAPKPSGGGDSSSTSTDPWLKTVSNICIGQACCDLGYTYEPRQNKCIPSNNNTTETFIANIFTKYAKSIENQKPDYTMGDKLPISYAST